MRHKYNAVKTVIDGITFPSKKEAKRYSELKMLGIEHERQVRYPMYVNGVLVCTYIADFVYRLPPAFGQEAGDVVVEDVKGVKTPTYQIKRKLMKAIYKIDIKEV